MENEGITEISRTTLTHYHCECGSSVLHKSLEVHRKTKRHKNYFNSI